MKMNLSSFKAFEVQNASSIKGGALLCFGGAWDDPDFGTCIPSSDLLFFVLEDEDRFAHQGCIDIDVSCETFNREP